jgi:GNAT superfamily N-acetyltransferase
MFSKYHYLSHSRPPGDEYVAFYNNRPIAYCNISVFPHGRAKNIMRISRIVTMPDYQGIGVGKQLLDYVSQLYKDKTKRVRIITSNRAFIQSLNKDPNWKLKHQGRQMPAHNKTAKFSNKTGNKLTTSWEYK